MNMKRQEGRSYGVVDCDIIPAFTRNLHKRLKKTSLRSSIWTWDLSNMKQKRPPGGLDVSRTVLHKKKALLAKYVEIKCQLDATEVLIAAASCKPDA